jgi:hypothetical protein
VASLHSRSRIASKIFSVLSIIAATLSSSLAGDLMITAASLLITSASSSTGTAGGSHLRRITPYTMTLWLVLVPAKDMCRCSGRKERERT